MLIPEVHWTKTIHPQNDDPARLARVDAGADANLSKRARWEALYATHGSALVCLGDDGEVFSAAPNDYWASSEPPSQLALHVPARYEAIVL